jgi:DNA repair photolyase
MDLESGMTVEAANSSSALAAPGELGSSMGNLRIQLEMEHLVASHRPLRDPYTALAIAIDVADAVGDPAVAAACRRIVDTRLLHETSGRRVPFLELDAQIARPLQRELGLSDEARDAVRFVLRLSFEYPGVVGSASAPLALKRTGAQDASTVASVDEILQMQRLAGPDGLNTTYLVSQMKGGMSVDYGIGCPLMCAYCYRREGDTVDGYIGKWQPVGFLEAHQAVERLLAHPWFTPHVTPIGLHMSTSEAFIPQNWPRTIETLRILDSLGLTNRVSCITKYGLTHEQIAELEALQNVDLDVNVCFADMPAEVEPPNRTKRIEFLKRISQSDRINVLAYFRPIAEGLNTTDQHFRNVWSVFKDAKAKVVVLGGLKFSEDHVNSFMSYGLPIPGGTFTVGKKSLSADSQARIMTVFEEVFRDVPEADRPAVLKRSSCGRVVVRGSQIPDYNAHWELPKQNCQLRCPMSQHQVCASSAVPSAVDIEALLLRLGQPDLSYRVTSRAVVVAARLTQFERTFMRQNLLFPVLTDHQYVSTAAGALK